MSLIRLKAFPERPEATFASVDRNGQPVGALPSGLG